VKKTHDSRLAAATGCSPGVGLKAIHKLLIFIALRLVALVVFSG